MIPGTHLQEFSHLQFERSQILRKTSSHRNLLKESQFTRANVNEKWETSTELGYTQNFKESLSERLRKILFKFDLILDDDDERSIYSKKIMEERGAAENLLKKLSDYKESSNEIDYSKFNFNTEELVTVVLENCEPEVSRMILELLRSKNSS